MNGKKIARKGFSLMEMLVVVGILALLASASVPVAELAFNSAKEAELEDALERMREAINLYRRDCRNAVVAQYGYDKLNTVPYCNLCPPSLEALTHCHQKSDGLWYDSSENIVSCILDENYVQVATFTPRNYLDAIPVDPFVGRPCWLVHLASGTDGAVAAYNFRENNTTRGYKIEDLGAGNTKPDPLPFPAISKGVFDVSCIPSGAVDSDDYYTRRGFNVSVDGTLYEDW